MHVRSVREGMAQSISRYIRRVHEELSRVRSAAQPCIMHTGLEEVSNLSTTAVDATAAP